MRSFLLCLFVVVVYSSTPAWSFSVTSNNNKESSLLTNRNSNDKEYPWNFTGRLWFRPAFVRVPTDKNKLPPSGVSVLSLFGWTVGGVVALEYDDSPVGPYREYVTMGAVVSKGTTVGQWGSKLYVSTRQAEEICHQVWKVPAQEADIQFLEGNNDASEQLCVTCPPDQTSGDGTIKIVVNGWANTRVLDKNSAATRSPGLPVLWTPSIKALWAPLPRLFAGNGDLPLHDLRLSASALRLCFCGQGKSETLCIPWAIGLVVDNVLIEIAPQNGTL